MAKAETNWERLVRAALRSDRGRTSAYGYPVTGIAGAVPTSLGNNVHIEDILRAADEIQDEDPNIARICKSFLFCQWFLVGRLNSAACFQGEYRTYQLARDKKNVVLLEYYAVINPAMLLSKQSKLEE
jgi:hypothetical protein